MCTTSTRERDLQSSLSQRRGLGDVLLTRRDRVSRSVGRWCGAVCATQHVQAQAASNGGHSEAGSCEVPLRWCARSTMSDRAGGCAGSCARAVAPCAVAVARRRPTVGCVRSARARGAARAVAATACTSRAGQGVRGRRDTAVRSAVEPRRGVRGVGRRGSLGARLRMRKAGRERLIEWEAGGGGRGGRGGCSVVLQAQREV